MVVAGLMSAIEVPRYPLMDAFILLSGSRSTGCNWMIRVASLTEI
jgi:hypothetical protein